MKDTLYYMDAIKEIIKNNTINNNSEFSDSYQEILNDMMSYKKIKIETVDNIYIADTTIDIDKFDPLHLNAKDLLCYIIENNIFFEDIVDKGFMCHNEFGTFIVTHKKK